MVVVVVVSGGDRSLARWFRYHSFRRHFYRLRVLRGQSFELVVEVEVEIGAGKVEWK